MIKPNLLIPGEFPCLSVLPVYMTLTIRDVVKYHSYVIDQNSPYYQTFSLVTRTQLKSINNFQYNFSEWAITDLFNQSFHGFDCLTSNSIEMYNYIVVGQLVKCLPGCRVDYIEKFKNYSPNINYWNFNTDYLTYNKNRISCLL